MNRHYELWIDMDEVIVDLSKYVVGFYNLDFNDNFDYTKNNSYWWGDCEKAPKLYFELLLNKAGVFYNAPPVDNAIDTLYKLNNEGFKIHVITMPQWYSDTCAKEKVLWLNKYLPFINVSTNVHLTGNKGVFAKENRILLDDNYEHLNNWNINNGVAVAFKQFGWNKLWVNDRVNSFDEFYNLVHNYEKNIHTKTQDSINLHNLRNYYINKLYWEGD